MNKFKLEDIKIRDPFILPIKEENRYYLYGTTDTDPWFGKGEGFRVWWSEDLEDWYGGDFAFVPPKNFWSDHHYWAPEVHYYKGAYYLIATFNAENHCRSVQIMKSKTPLGPFEPISDGPITPAKWECLDGTLYVEEGTPWMIFCHEWTQIHDGAICAMKLRDDLTEAISEPIVLFHASEAPWSIADTGNVITMPGENHVTDGPYLFTSRTGELNMLWSSYSETGYAIGTATSETGTILGPWRQSSTPFFQKDGGHGMVFKTFEGQMKLAIHAPNISPYERTKLIDLVL